MSELIDPLKDGKSRIQLIGYMGNDLSIVNDAKASFAREATEIGEREEKLIEYLMRSRPKHTSPFRGVVFKFKVKAPLFIARQWFKHLVASNHNDEQLGWNEKSLRYSTITETDEFYIPENFRTQDKRNKQASSGFLESEANSKAIAIYSEKAHNSYEAYNELIELGVSRDQARGILAPAIYTSWVWTTSLQAVLHFIDLRKGSGAQYEISFYAEAIRSLISPIVPLAVKYWEEL